MQKTYQQYNHQGRRPIQNAHQQISPAYSLALRIKTEQGPNQAAEFLAAMEPFIAPAERIHIADQLGLPLIEYRRPHQAPAPERQSSNGFDPMQLMTVMNMLSGLNGQSGSGQSQGQGKNDPSNPMMMFSLLSQLMGASK